MINYETILSAFDDKETLLKWLQKVEKALAESTLATVDCVNVDDSHIKFTFNFVDGTKIDTPQVYVKPGVDGTDGRDGIGFNTLSEVFIPSAVSSLTYSDAKGAIVSGDAVFKTADRNFTVTAKNIIPIFGKSGVALAKDDTGKKLEVSLSGYDAASTGYYPRKSSSGLEWVAGTGGGATVETGTFTAPIYQASPGSSSSSWTQISGDYVSGSYSFIGDILTVRLYPSTTSRPSIPQSKTFYISLLPLMNIFNIPLTARNISLGTQLSAAGSAISAYAHTYVEDGVMFAIQFQKTLAYATSTNAFVTTASFGFLCPNMAFTINGVTKK